MSTANCLNEHVENNINHQQQYDTPPQLPEGWRKVYTPDQRVYFQNEITKQTQWNRPTMHTNNNNGQISMARIEAKTQIVKPASTQTEEDSNNVTPRKLWHHDHIFWLITFCLNIYDFYTDYLVVNIWKDARMVCTQFRCPVIDPTFADDGWIILLIFSSVGFLVALIQKFIDGKKCYILYRYPITNSYDLRARELENFEFKVLVGWIPLLLEDIVSIGCLYAAIVLGYRDVDGVVPVYAQSILVGLCTIITSWIWTTYKMFKYRQDLGGCCNMAKKPYTKLAFWICWCMLSGFVYGALVTLVTLQVPLARDYSTDPIVDLYTAYQPNLCENFYVDDSYDEIFSIHGEIMTGPKGIYYENDTEFIDYSFSINCYPKNFSDYKLNCNLTWSWTEQIQVYVDNYRSVLYFGYCPFNIEVGFCSNFVIQCMNNKPPICSGFPGVHSDPEDCDYYLNETILDETAGNYFVNGNATTYACFQYCSV
eukprot:470304_1